MSGDRINFDKNLVNVCVNVNVNEQANTGEDGQTCEECFTQNLDSQDQTELLTEIRDRTGFTSFEDLCEEIPDLVETQDETGLQTLINALFGSFEDANLSIEQFNTVLDCLNEVFNGVIPDPDIS